MVVVAVDVIFVVVFSDADGVISFVVVALNVPIDFLIYNMVAVIDVVPCVIYVVINVSVSVVGCS